MGCWDVFCLACGNPGHGMFFDSPGSFLDIISWYEKIKDSKSKDKQKINLKAELKTIYEYWVKNPDFIQTIKRYEKITKWMHKCTFLTVQNKVVSGCKEVGCNVEFVDKNNIRYLHGLKNNLLDANSGVFIHTDCWKYIKSKFNISLNYSCLSITKLGLKNKLIDSIKYYGEKYWAQDYNFTLAIIENPNLLLSPKNSLSKTRTQIQKVITGLKIKNLANRKSPINSATFYKSGTYKIGLDKHIWFIKNDKWVSLKDETNKINIIVGKNDNQLNKLVKKLVFVGESNSIAAFIIDMQQKKEVLHLNLLCGNEMVLQLKQLKAI